MTDASRFGPKRTKSSIAIDQVAGMVSLAAVLMFIGMTVILGPVEAMERLAVLLRKALPLW